MSQGGYRRIATGIATKDIERGSVVLFVHALELFPDIDAEYVDGLKLPDSKDAVIRCIWYHDGGNRVVPPTIRHGETVEIYQYADADIYYWKGGQYEPDVRGLEEAAFAWSNIPRQTDKSKHLDKMNKDNSYFFSISTISKFIKLHTSKNDKEPYTWDFFLNTKSGILKIFNGIKDSITIGKGEIKIVSKKIVLEADEIIINGRKHVLVDSSMVETNGGSTVVGTSSATVKCGITFKGASNFKAHVTMNKNAITTNKGKVL